MKQAIKECLIFVGVGTRGKQWLLLVNAARLAKPPPSAGLCKGQISKRELYLISLDYNIFCIGAPTHILA